MKMLARSRILLVAIIASSVSVLLYFLLPMSEISYARYGQGPRAAIIDQLYDDYQNPLFQQTAKMDLEHAGYTVDIYTTKNITVGFYKNLSSMDYKFIVIRTHASLALNNSTAPSSADLFTGEKYQAGKYTIEQILGQVQQSGYILLDYSVTHMNGSFSLNRVSSDSGTYFSVGSKFVDEQMQGKFPGSIVIIGGCASLSNPILADSLVRRGASVIIGWDNLVSADQNDSVMLAVLNSLLLDKSSIDYSVKSAMKQFGPDYLFSARLKYYPPNAGGIQAGAN